MAAQLFSDPVLLGTTSADAAGTFTMAVMVPADTAPGAHTVRVSVLGGGPFVELPLVVTGPRAQHHQRMGAATAVGGGTVGTLSRTGGQFGRTAALALALVVLGFAFLGLTVGGATAHRGWPRRWPARRRWW